MERNAFGRLIGGVLGLSSLGALGALGCVWRRTNAAASWKIGRRMAAMERLGYENLSNFSGGLARGLTTQAGFLTLDEGLGERRSAGSRAGRKDGAQPRWCGTAC